METALLEFAKELGKEIALGIGLDEISRGREFRAKLDQTQFSFNTLASSLEYNPETVKAMLDLPGDLDELEQAQAETGALKLLPYGVSLQDYGPIADLAKFNEQHFGVPFETGLAESIDAIKTLQPDLLDLPGISGRAKVEELRGQFPGLDERSLMLQAVRSFVDEERDTYESGQKNQAQAEAERVGREMAYQPELGEIWLRGQERTASLWGSIPPEDYLYQPGEAQLRLLQEQRQRDRDQTEAERVGREMAYQPELGEIWLRGQERTASLWGSMPPEDYLYQPGETQLRLLQEQRQKRSGTTQR